MKNLSVSLEESKILVEGRRPARSEHQEPRTLLRSKSSLPLKASGGRVMGFCDAIAMNPLIRQIAQAIAWFEA